MSLANPKSQIFTTLFSERRMFRAAKSRWMHLKRKDIFISCDIYTKGLGFLHIIKRSVVFYRRCWMAVGRGTHGKVISDATIGDDGFLVRTGGEKHLQVDYNKRLFFSLIAPIRSSGDSRVGSEVEKLD